MVKLKLIDNEFSPSEYKEILFNIFFKKIEFHKIKNFSSQIRYGIDDPTSVQKIAELNQSIEKIAELFEEAKKKNQRLFVFSEIQIDTLETKSTSNEN